MQTALYVRISRDLTGEGLGVTRQLEDCQALADELGWTVVEVYRDNDISAYSSKPRPQYEAMLTDIEADKIGAIIAWHPDRLYRRAADLERLITIVEAHDVQIRTVRYGDFDLATPTGRGIARILGGVAQMEVEVKADRQKRAWRQHRERGTAPGGQRLYGYQGHQIVEHEADTIRWLADRILAGATIRSLATDLNRRGITTAGGSEWKPHGIRKLLLNPRLAGHSTHKGDVVGQGDWEPILDDPTWQTVRSLLIARSKTAQPRSFLLVGLAYCGRCEAPLRSGRDSRTVRRYRCFAGPGLPGCGKLTVVADPVDQLVEGVVRTYLTSPKIRQRLAEARAGGQTHVLAELDAQQRRLDEINEAIDAGGLTVGEAKALGRATDATTNRIDQLQAQLAATSPARIPADLEVDWPTELGERRRLVELVVARVWVDPAKVVGAPFDPGRVRIDPTDLVTG